jgi:cobyrinic acid a,c-diamide synthase
MIRKIPGRQSEDELDSFAAMDNRLRGMCEKASKEKDPARLMEIVRRVMAIYEEMDKAEKNEGSYHKR